MDNIGFLIAYTTQFPKMYRFANLPKMPTKLHSEPDYSVYASYSSCFFIFHHLICGFLFLGLAILLKLFL